MWFRSVTLARYLGSLGQGRGALAPQSGPTGALRLKQALLARARAKRGARVLLGLQFGSVTSVYTSRAVRLRRATFAKALRQVGLTKTYTAATQNSPLASIPPMSFVRRLGRNAAPRRRRR